MKTKGLTIQEAIQSGLPFKREGCLAWYRTTKQPVFSIEHILAQDWEIKVPEVTITREKLAEAWDKKLAGESGLCNLSYLRAECSMAFDAFAKELGL